MKTYMTPVEFKKRISALRETMTEPALLKALGMSRPTLFRKCAGTSSISKALAMMVKGMAGGEPRKTKEASNG